MNNDFFKRLGTQAPEPNPERRDDNHVRRSWKIHHCVVCGTEFDITPDWDGNQK